MSAAREEILEVRAVRRVHATLSLDISLRLGCEIGVVFGPSGAGKTTLLRLISGLSTPDSGRICLGGTILYDAKRRVDEPLRRRRIGMIFQHDLLFPHLNIAANIRFGLKGWGRDAAKSRLAEMATLCGVEHLMERMPATLSGGERQRVGLARAIAPCPGLLLCDEPVSALDLSNRHTLLERLRAVQRVLSIPILYVTHSHAEAIALGTRLFLLEQGRIVADGPPLDVLSAVRHGSEDTIAWEGIRNVFPASVIGHEPESSATRLRLDDGPDLVVPFLGRPPETRLLVAVPADDILLASHPLGGLGARNQIPGQIERILRHGPEAEVIVRTGGLKWIVSVVAPAVLQLELVPGTLVHLVVKARSCRILDDPPPSPRG